MNILSIKCVSVFPYEKHIVSLVETYCFRMINILFSYDKHIVSLMQTIGI